MFHEKAATPTVLAVEQPFSVDFVDPSTGEFPEPKLVGALDLTVQGANRSKFVEHKTALNSRNIDPYDRPSDQWSVRKTSA